MCEMHAKSKGGREKDKRGMIDAVFGCGSGRAFLIVGTAAS
jgi:hypothetical protein